MIYLQVSPVSNGTRSIKVNTLLDSSSDSSLDPEVLANKLKLIGEDQPLSLSNAVCMSTPTMSDRLDVRFSMSHNQ